MTTTHAIIDTPIGDLTLVGADGALTGVYYPGHWTMPDRATFGPRAEGGFQDAGRQLTEYLEGERTTFDLRTSVAGDAFQRRVWALLAEIPYGETTTYGTLARALGDPALARMVGRAVGANPLSVIVPCHRVIGTDGTLTGYAGGLERKRFLLALEVPAVWGLEPVPRLF
ncbi:MAG: methylated-DNA-[protein]-cysteine S-methyltransferase [Solirubrobacteraceae bacterium]|jgi:methylated-DNA-[protein]-cysteine S-methyltransferase|nr:methylated-DNA-[protein]-cysteine S-methyltransferase [Solirubrobacteraceae bacterium]